MRERIYDTIGDKKIRETAQDKSLFVGASVLSVQKATKRKPAQMTIIINDELATPLIEDIFTGRTDMVIRGLILNWAEYHTEEVISEQATHP